MESTEPKSFSIKEVQTEKLKTSCPDGSLGITVTNENLKKYEKVLCFDKYNVVARYDAIFHVKTIGGEEALEVLHKSFKFQEGSELLMHEIAYTIGQMGNTKSLPFLKEIVENEEEMPVIRHEAAEGIANLGIGHEALEILNKYTNHPNILLRITCVVGIGKINRILEGTDHKFGKKYNGTQEPAEPLDHSDIEPFLKSLPNQVQGDIYEQIEKHLLYPVGGQLLPDYLQYRLVYFLREDAKNKKSMRLLAKLLQPEFKKVTNPLLRHEIGFIVGQLATQCMEIKEILEGVIRDETEEPIVRHEVILGYSSVVDEPKIM